MGHLTAIEEIEREIEAVMRDQGIARDGAEVVVGLRRGELHGDILFVHPLTQEQRRRLNIGRDPEEVLAEQRERRASDTSVEAVPPPRGTAAS